MFAKLCLCAMAFGFFAVIGHAANGIAPKSLPIKGQSEAPTAAAHPSQVKPKPKPGPPNGRTGNRAAHEAAPKGHGGVAPAGSKDAPKRSPKGVLPDGRVVLNVASAKELTRLRGVGPKRAQAIVGLRKRMRGGRFRRVRDLLRIRGIGRRTLARLRPQLVLDSP